MSRAPRVDPRAHLAAVVAATARPDQPAATYAALETALHAVLGHHSPMGYELRTAGNAPGRIINWSGKPGQSQ